MLNVNHITKHLARKKSLLRIHDMIDESVLFTDATSGNGPCCSASPCSSCFYVFFSHKGSGVFTLNFSCWDQGFLSSLSSSVKIKWWWFSDLNKIVWHLCLTRQLSGIFLACGLPNPTQLFSKPLQTEFKSEHLGTLFINVIQMAVCVYLTTTHHSD